MRLKKCAPYSRDGCRSSGTGGLIFLLNGFNFAVHVLLSVLSLCCSGASATLLAPVVVVQLLCVRSTPPLETPSFDPLPAFISAYSGSYTFSSFKSRSDPTRSRGSVATGSCCAVSVKGPGALPEAHTFSSSGADIASRESITQGSRKRFGRQSILNTGGDAPVRITTRHDDSSVSAVTRARHYGDGLSGLPE